MASFHEVRKVQPGERPSASQANIRRELIGQALNRTLPNGVVDSTGAYSRPSPAPAGTASEFFPVTVTRDGGNPGGFEHSADCADVDEAEDIKDCTLTYTVKDKDGNTLATEVTPDTKRMSGVQYQIPTNDSPAMAYYDDEGNLHLYHVAEEVPLTSVKRVQLLYRIDGFNFEIKHRWVCVFEGGGTDESDWCVVHEGDDCEDD